MKKPTEKETAILENRMKLLDISSRVVFISLIKSWSPYVNENINKI